MLHNKDVWNHQTVSVIYIHFGCRQTHYMSKLIVNITRVNMNKQIVLSRFFT